MRGAWRTLQASEQTQPAAPCHFIGHRVRIDGMTGVGLTLNGRRAVALKYNILNDKYTVKIEKTGKGIQLPAHFIFPEEIAIESIRDGELDDSIELSDGDEVEDAREAFIPL